MHPDVWARRASGADGGLWEREAERQAILSLLDCARRGAGGALVFEGHAGLGKTRLLDLATQSAAGFCVLRAAGREATHGYPYAMVREAVGSLLAGPRSTLRRLAENQPALVPFIRDQPLAQEAQGPLFAAEVAGALFWLLKAAAERDSLLLLLDDLQWCDLDSREFWRTLAAAASSLPMAIILAYRPWEPGAPQPAGRFGKTGATRVLALRPLGEASIQGMLSAALGTPPDAALIRQAAALTGGNPLLVRELGRLIQAGGSMASTDTGRDILHWRLADLPAASLELLRAASVLGVEFDAGLAAEVARLPAPQVALEPLLALDLLRPLPAPTRLAFHHPLLRQVTYDALGPRRRTTLHRRAAESLRGRRAAASVLVPHLVAMGAAGPAILDTLQAAAAEAVAAGAAETAAQYLRQAADITASGAQRAEILLELGRVELRAGADTSAERFRQAADTPACTDAVRLEALRSLGLSLTLSGATARAREVLGEAAAQAWAAGAEAPAAECLVALSIVTMTTGEMPAALECAQRAKEAAERSGQPGVRAKAMAVWANAAFQQGDDRALDVAREAMLRMPPSPPDDVEQFWGWSVSTAFGMIAMRSEQYREADDVFTAMAAAADRRHSRAGSVWACAFRAELAWRRGRVREALRLVEDTTRLPIGIPWATALAAAVRGCILVDAGLIAEAEAAFDRAETEGTGLRPALLWTRFGRASVAAQRGRHDLAADLLLDAIERAEVLGVRDPSSLPWHLDAAQACMRCGRLERARRLIDDTRERARTFRRPGLEAAALRQAACLAGRDHHAEATRLFDEALQALEQLDLPMERGRTLLDLGVLLRQTGRLPQARQVLGEAVDVLEGCGAERWRRIAEAERRGAGGRSRRTPNARLLTPQEDRIAQLVAQGHTNRQIAAHLWISPKTLETHLSHIYAKLGLRTRIDLSAWASDRPRGPAD